MDIEFKKHFITFISLFPLSCISPPPLTSQFLPLNQTIDYLFRNNKKNISTQVTLHLLHEYQHNHLEFHFFYTDGSRQDGKTGAGVTSSHYENANSLPNFFSVFSAELSAILHAINYIPHIVYLIKKNLYNLAKANIEIKLLWIPLVSHSGVPGNTRADQLAKNSPQLPERRTTRCTHQDAAIEVRAAFNKLRQLDWDSFPHPHLHPIHPKIEYFRSSNQDSRIKEVVFARMRLGHTIITHVHIYEKEPPHMPTLLPPTRLNLANLLLNCDHYKQHRRRMFAFAQTNNIDLDIPTLLNDNHPELINLLLDYLRDSNLLHRI